jgi:hypothetical protein
MGQAPRSSSSANEFVYSPAVTVSVNASFGIGTNLSWDAYARHLYQQADAALQRQANLLLASGRLTEADVRALSAQRDLIRTNIRNQLSPFGRLYSEILAPAARNPSFEERLLEKGSLEALVKSVGKSRAVVNKLVTRMRWAGRATIVVQVVFSAVLIAEAAPEERARVASRQGGAIGGGVVGGWAGAWAGCAGGALLASPSLVIPFVGEVSTGGACLVGGLVGGLGLGAVGASLGERAGGAIYDYVTTINWSRR